MSDVYPDFVWSLPDADIPLEGVRGKLLQGKDQQVVFFEIEPIGTVPPHSHGDQWGVMVQGEMDLVIGDETHRIKTGDHYYVPAGVTHSATFLTKVYAIDVFADVDRYKPRK